MRQPNRLPTYGQAFTDSITPASNDGAALGSSTLRWSDLFLAAGAVINCSTILTFTTGNYTQFGTTLHPHATTSYFGGTTTNDTLMSSFSSAFNQFQILIGSASGRQVVIGDPGSNGQDFDHDGLTNPTLFIQSATAPNTNNTQWVSLSHDQTDAVLGIGAGGLKFTDLNFVLGTTTGTKFGSATNQKLSFFNAAPIVQQTTTSQTPATFAANTSGIADDTGTWDGYTIGDVVAILRAFGLLA